MSVNLPSSYQNLLKLVEIWQSSNKTKMLPPFFLRHGVYSHCMAPRRRMLNHSFYLLQQHLQRGNSTNDIITSITIRNFQRLSLSESHVIWWYDYCLVGMCRIVILFLFGFWKKLGFCSVEFCSVRFEKTLFCSDIAVIYYLNFDVTHNNDNKWVWFNVIAF